MSIQQYLDKIKNAVYGREVRGAIHDAIKQTYDDAAEGGDANMEVELARGTFPNLNARLVNQDEEIDDLKRTRATKQELQQGLNPKADQSYVDDQLANIISGSPRRAFSSLQYLRDTYPNGADGIYLITENGHWYYWSESANDWTDGGVYQGTTISQQEWSDKARGIGEVKYLDDPVDINSQTKEITFPSFEEGKFSRLLINGFAHSLNSGNSRIIIPEAIDIGKLYFNTETQTWRVATLMDDNNPANPYEYLVMAFRLRDPKRIIFNGEYILDGYKNNEYKSGEVKCVSNGLVDVKTNPREVVFPSSNGTRTWLFVDTHGIELDDSNSRIELPSSAYGNVVKVLFNIESKTLLARRWTEEIQPNEHLVMGINFLAEVPDVSFNGSYVIDGQSEADNVKEEVEQGLSMNFLRYNLEDSIYSWWAFPISKRYVGHRDKTYLSYTDSEGYTGVASIDNNSGQIVKKRLKKKDIDDHNAGAIGILDDGRIMAVYASGHNQDNNMYARISSKIESVEEFGEEIVIPIENGTAWENRTTYAQLHYKNGKHFLFFRTGNTNWTYMYTENGVDWSKPIKFLVAGMQYYCKVVETSDDNLLRIVMYSNPNETDYDMRLGFFDTTTLDFKLQDGTVVGTEEINKDEFPVILPAEQGKKQRLLDVAVTDVNETIIAYATFTTHENPYTPASDVVYKVAYYTDALRVVDLVDGGYPFYYASTYVGGVVFGYDSNTVFLSRQEGDTGVWYIEKWQTSDKITWNMVEKIHQSKQGSVAIRPVIEEDGDKLFWQEGFYDIYSFNNNNVDYKYAKIRE